MTPGMSKKTFTLLQEFWSTGAHRRCQWRDKREGNRDTQLTIRGKLDKARELGAEVVRIKSDDPAQALLDFARAHGIAHVVVGRSLQPWWKQVLLGSVLTRLLREGGDFDLHVVASSGEERQ